MTPLLGRPAREPAPPVRLGPGERLLAWARGVDGTVVGGSRDAFYAVPAGDAEATVRIPWERVQAADWDRDEERFRLLEVGSYGEPRATYEARLEEPGRLLELVRERVTASVVMERQVLVEGTRGFRVIARRAPRGDRAPEWFCEFDRGVDPDDPAVRRLATAALAAAREELGLG